MNKIFISTTENSATLTDEPIGNLVSMAYTTPAHIFTDDVNSPVVANQLGTATASNNHEAGRGSLLGSDLIDKVMTGQTAPATHNKLVEDYSFNGSLLDDEASVRPAHSAINLSNAEYDKGFKSLPHLTTKNGQVYLAVKFKEMIFDATWGDSDDFVITDNTATDVDSNGNVILLGTKSTPLPWIMPETGEE